VTGLLGLDSEYSAEAYGVHIIKQDGEKIEVSGNVITYRDKRGNKFTYRKRDMASFLIID
jgi:phage pi2 protein 07